eukprot:1054850-Amphidinium_carterae.1
MERWPLVHVFVKPPSCSKACWMPPMPAPRLHSFLISHLPRPPWMHRCETSYRSSWATADVWVSPTIAPAHLQPQTSNP